MIGDFALVLGIAVSVISVIGSLVAVAFKMGAFATNLSQNTALTTKVYNIVVKQDDRIQSLEDGKADKEQVNEIDRRLLVIETQHKANHKE